MTSTYTAHITTRRSMLESDHSDISVLDEDGHPVQVIDMDIAADTDDQAALKLAAIDILEDSGWSVDRHSTVWGGGPAHGGERIDTTWTPTADGYHATVTR